MTPKGIIEAIKAGFVISVAGHPVAPGTCKYNSSGITIDGEAIPGTTDSFVVVDEGPFRCTTKLVGRFF